MFPALAAGSKGIYIMKKKLRIVVLLLALSLLICGCSQQENKPEEQGTQQTYENGLGVWEIGE